MKFYAGLFKKGGAERLPLLRVLDKITGTFLAGYIIVADYILLVQVVEIDKIVEESYEAVHGLLGELTGVVGVAALY